MPVSERSDQTSHILGLLSRVIVRAFVGFLDRRGRPVLGDGAAGGPPCPALARSGTPALPHLQRSVVLQRPR